MESHFGQFFVQPPKSLKNLPSQFPLWLLKLITFHLVFFSFWGVSEHSEEELFKEEIGRDAVLPDDEALQEDSIRDKDIKVVNGLTTSRAGQSTLSSF